MGLLLLFSGGGAQTKSHAIDASIVGVKTKTHLIDALAIATVVGTKTHGIEAGVGIFATSTKFVLVNGIIKKTQTVTQGIDSRLFGVLGVPLSHGIEAVIGQRVKTVSIDGSILKTSIKTHSLDAFNEKTSTVAHGIEARVGVNVKQVGIDFITKKTLSLSHFIDATRTKAGNTLTYSLDSFIFTGSTTKTHGIDLIAKGTITTSHQIQAELYLQRNTKSYAVAARLTKQNQIIDNLEDALAQPVLHPRTRILHILNMNNYVNGTISCNIDADEASNILESLIDGYDRPSMKYAFTNFGCFPNQGYRLFPDVTNVEGDDYIDYPKVPWVSDTRTNDSGAFSTPIEFTTSYSSTGVDCNAIRVVTDPYGGGGGGVPTNLTIQISDNGASWTTIASNVNGQSQEKPYKTTIWYTENGWVTTRPDDLSAYTTIYFVRYIFNAISTDATREPDARDRPLIVYELAPMLFNENKVHNSELVSVNITESRDLSQQSLSPVAGATSNTINISGVDFEEKLYEVMTKEFYVNTPAFQNSLIEVSIGFRLSSGEYEYVDYGTFVIDDTQISSNNSLSITGRDFSKYLQDSRMPPFFYENYRLHEVVRDVVERAGIEEYQIDTSVLGREELATGVTREFIGVDELSDIIHDNNVWNVDSTYWEFLQQLANSDLGAYYFDREGKFIYKAKEEFSDPTGEYDYDLTEEDNLLTFSSQRQIAKNIFKLRYKVPHKSEEPLGLWEATEPIILDTTSLAGIVDSATDTIPVGTIEDWNRQGYVQIDNEIIKYNDRTDNAFLKCERGHLGTTPAPHYPTNSEADWNFQGGDWQITGGQLVARNQGNSWGRALYLDEFAHQRYNMKGILTINSAPYRCGIIVRAANPLKHYMFSIKSVARINESDGVTGDAAEHLYQLYEVDAGDLRLLEQTGDKKKVKRLVYTSQPTEFQVQVDKEQLSLFIRGTRVLTYELTDDDIDVAFPAKIGFAARGKGPTEFDRVQLSSLSEGTQGETLLWSEMFGKPVYEIRKFEPEFANSPASGIQYYLTNNNNAEVIYFKPGPFKASAYVKNLRDGLTVINYTFSGEDEDFSEYFYMTGYGIKSEEEKEVQLKNDVSIVKYGKQELDMSVPWVQSETHGEALLEYLEDVYSDAVDLVQVGIHPNPLIEIGKVVKLSGSEYNLLFSQNDERNKNIFHVTEIRTDINSQGMTQNLGLRSLARKTMVPVVSGVAASVAVPPSSFYVNNEFDYAPTLSYPGYSETVYGKSSTDVPVSTDALTIPITVWRPSNTAGTIDNNNIMNPSANPAGGSHKTIIWAHEGFPFNKNEEPNDYYIKKWLIKIVRKGYNIIFVNYRGTGSFGAEHFNKMSYGRIEIDDLNTVANWADAKSYVGKIIFGGYGHGGHMALSATRVYPGWDGYFAISGTPNVGASILRPETNWPRFVVDRYTEALGRIEDGSSEWIGYAPVGDITSITSGKILMVNGQLDTFASIKDVYEFHAAATAAGKNITTYAYKNETQGFVFMGDAGNPNKIFQSDPWLRIMYWLDNV